MGNRVWFLNKYCYKPFTALPRSRFPRVLLLVASFSSTRDECTHAAPFAARGMYKPQSPCVHNVVVVCVCIIRQALTPLPLDIYTCLFETSANYIIHFLTKRVSTRVFLTKDIPFFVFFFFLLLSAPLFYIYTRAHKILCKLFLSHASRCIMYTTCIYVLRMYMQSPKTPTIVFVQCNIRETIQYEYVYRLSVCSLNYI